MTLNTPSLNVDETGQDGRNFPSNQDTRDKHADSEGVVISKQDAGVVLPDESVELPSEEGELEVRGDNKQSLVSCQHTHPRHINFSYIVISFTLLSLLGKLVNIILATLVSLHQNIYTNGEKLAAFKSSHLFNKRKWRKLGLISTFHV